MSRVLKVATDSAFLVRRGLSRSLSDGAKPPVDVVRKLKEGRMATEHAEDSVPKDEEFQKKEYSSVELLRDELKRELANFKMEMRDEIKKLATEAKLDIRAEKLDIRDNLVDWKKDVVNRLGTTLDSKGSMKVADVPEQLYSHQLSFLTVTHERQGVPLNQENYGKLCGRIEATKAKMFKYMIVGVVITTWLLK